MRFREPITVLGARRAARRRSRADKPRSCAAVMPAAETRETSRLVQMVRAASSCAGQRRPAATAGSASVAAAMGCIVRGSTQDSAELPERVGSGGRDARIAALSSMRWCLNNASSRRLTVARAGSSFRSALACRGQRITPGNSARRGDAAQAYRQRVFMMTRRSMVIISAGEFKQTQISEVSGSSSRRMRCAARNRWCVLRKSRRSRDHPTRTFFPKGTSTRRPTSLLCASSLR